MSKNSKKITFILLVIISLNGLSQNTVSDSLNTPTDTLINPSDSSKVIRQKKANAIYEKIKAFRKRNRIYNELFHAVFRNVETAPKKGEIIESISSYKAYSGKIVNTINIVQLNVFDKTFDENRNYSNYKSPPKGYSKIHVNTLKKVIKKNIMFNVSDTINPVLIVRNSKHLRDLPYIQDAIIQLYEKGKDSVDVYVVTQDRFPWDIIPSYLNFDKWRFRLRNNNIGGLGSDFNNTYLLDNNEEEKLIMSSVSTNINNIRGSFINGTIGYDIAKDFNTYYAGLSRPFIPFKVNWGGGANFNLYKQLEKYTQNDSLLSHSYTMRKYSDFWIGRQFQINKNKGFLFNSPLWLTPAIRFSNLSYIEEPFTNKNYNMLMWSIGASSQKYYKLRYVNEFGRTEYIQQGIMAKLTGGYQFMKDVERNYGGVSFGYRRKTLRNGLCFLLFEFGTYFNKNTYSQGTLKSKISYMMPLINLGREKLRNSIWIEYTMVSNRTSGDFIYIENPDISHRVILSDLYGTQKLLAHIESNLFSSIDFYGFKVSAFAALEFGYIGFKDDLFNSNMVKALSLGFRVRNDFLIFNTMQFRFTFYSKNLSPYINTNFDVNEMSRLRHDDLSVGKPSTISY